MKHAAKQPATTGLEVCTSCGGPYVFPTAWGDGANWWHMVLQCGQCRFQRRVSVPAEVGKRYRDDMERFAAQIKSGLGRTSTADLHRELGDLPPETSRKRPGPV